MRRLFELLILSFFLIIVITIGSKWSFSSPSSSSINDNYQHIRVKVNPIPVNPFLPHEQSLNFNNDNNNKNNEKPINGRPNLAKYIHLDLKGAPPQANKFYETYFNFLNKLQMGVKGILIEYEDMLPLQGRFINVNI